MNELMDFEGQPVRMVGTMEQPEWVAADVCRVLGILNTSDALIAIPEDEKGIGETYTLGGKQELLTLNEPGLYRLLFRSNKPEAERFRRWVFHEVLPTLRKTGKYAVNKDPIIAQMETLIEVRQAQLALEERTEQANRMALEAHQAAQAALDTVEDNYHHYSVLGYCNLIGQSVTVKEAAVHGRKLSKLCADQGSKVHKVKDTRFGEVNTYPQEMLEQYFGQPLRQPNKSLSYLPTGARSR